MAFSEKVQAESRAYHSDSPDGRTTGRRRSRSRSTHTNVDGPMYGTGWRFYPDANCVTPILSEEEQGAIEVAGEELYEIEINPRLARGAIVKSRDYAQERGGKDQPNAKGFKAGRGYSKGRVKHERRRETRLIRVNQDFLLDL